MKPLLILIGLFLLMFVSAYFEARRRVPGLWKKDDDPKSSDKR
jgi:hypothetical protein